jgi:hypothetical protein
MHRRVPDGARNRGQPARLVAAAAALATIPIGTEWTAAGQLAVLTAIVVAALLVEARHTVELPVADTRGPSGPAGTAK